MSRKLRHCRRALLCALASWCVAHADAPQVMLAQSTNAAAAPQPAVGVAAPGAATLPFDLALSFSCPVATARRQLFVSIADTSVIEDATATPSPQALRFEVPLRQLAWLGQPATQCETIADKRPPDRIGDDGIRWYRLDAGAMGYAMLTCTAKDGAASTAAVSAALDVWLSCPAP